jgi:GNAT superfamily N-acetyltransferase
MPISLSEVKTKKDLRKFIRFPLKLYKDNPYYVPALMSDEIKTLHPDKNPAFEHSEARYWLAEDHGEIVGRVAAIINHRHIEKWQQPYMRFSWLDFIDDQRVSSALLSAVENWAVERGMTAIHGPLGFTDLDREAMLVEGFNELATMATNYNYPYYPEHMTALGFIKDIDWIEFELLVPEKLDPRITRAAKIVLKRNNLRLADYDKKRDIIRYAPQLFELINSEYSHIYGSTPLSESEIEHYTQAYFGFVHPDFVPFILDENDQMVAFGVVIPSLSKALQKCRGRLFPFGWWQLLRALRKNDRADLYLIAVKKKYRGRGLNMVLMDHICKVFNQRGIQYVETNPELETNRDVQSQWKTLDKRQHKRRRCFIKHLSQ